jgi:hypothetical protein
MLMPSHRSNPKKSSGYSILFPFKKKINIKSYSIIFPTKSKEMQEKKNSKFSMGQLP